MKKYLVAFGLCGIFFAGFSGIVFADKVQSTTWKPSYTSAKSQEDCSYGEKDDQGIWISKTVKLSDDNKRCLEKNICNNLDFDVTRWWKDSGNKYQYAKVKLENGDYIVSEVDKITCSQAHCYIDTPNTADRIELKCYESEKHKKLITTQNKQHCVVNLNDLRISAIDYPRTSQPEWYCPYSFEQVYPGEIEEKDELNPYNSQNKYFTENLKKIYGESIENDNVLVHDCALRMYALGKSCKERIENSTDNVDQIKKIRGNYYDRKSIELWLGKMIKKNGIKAYNQWEEIKDIKFKDICGALKEGKCSRDVSKEKDLGENAKKAIKAVQDWLKQNKNLRTSNETPANYFLKEAKNTWTKKDKDGKYELSVSKVTKLLKKSTKDFWGGSETLSPSDKEKLESLSGKQWTNLKKLGWEGNGTAFETYSSLVGKKSNSKKTANLVSKYISRRNMDLNVSVSLNETSKVNIKGRLRAFGDEKNGSKEADLTFFEGKGENVIDKAIRLAVQLMGTVGIFLLIVSGAIMVFSRGEEDQLAKAKSVFIYTIIGLIVGFLSYTIVRFVIDTLLN